MLSRSSSNLATTIPPDIIQYVENGRNPDIYTREFVEMAQRMNQQLKGRSAALTQFRNTLAMEIKNSIPELEQEVGEVVRTENGIT